MDMLKVDLGIRLRIFCHFFRTHMPQSKSETKPGFVKNGAGHRRTFKPPVLEHALRLYKQNFSCAGHKLFLRWPQATLSDHEVQQPAE